MVKKLAPIVPEHTCPYIDMAKELIESMVDQEDAVWRKNQGAVVSALLEYVRESNEQLRQCGIYWYEKNKKSERLDSSAGRAPV